jgi:hypothetical protein
VLETEDLYLAAYLLTCSGSELQAVEVKNLNGRRLAVFRIDGDQVKDYEGRYWRGDAVVNLQLLKFQLRRLKDTAFAAIRADRGEERDDAHAPSGRFRAAVAAQPHRRARR